MKTTILTLFLLSALPGRTSAVIASNSTNRFANPISLSLDENLHLSHRSVSLSYMASRRLTFGVSNSEHKHHVRRRTEDTRMRNPREKVESLKAYYYFIQALGHSERDGCKHPQPSFTATCPEGAFIVAQSSKSEWTSRLDCNQTDTTSILCEPKKITEETQADIDLEDQNGVVIACYAEEDDNLQVYVQVHAGSYFCDKALEVRSMPHPAVTSGGMVYQMVAIQKQCWQNNGEAESWIFVEPTCGSSPGAVAKIPVTSNKGEDDMLQYTEVPVQTKKVEVDREYMQLSTAIVAHCQMQDNCAVELECSPKCAGRSSCNVNLPGFVTTSTSVPTAANLPDYCAPRNIEMNLRDGEACEFNLMCDSGVCVRGFCESLQKDNLEPCEEGWDCASQACGKYPVSNISSIESVDIPNKSCCPSGSIFGYKGESFCSESQPNGAACHENAMCSSNICVFNTCRSDLLDDGAECEEPNNCLGGHCGYYHDEDTKVCCATGNSILLSEGPMCSNRPAGDMCQNSANSLCESNICVGQVCQATEQEVGERCDNHFDCANDACALASADPSSAYICCPTGEYVFLKASPEEISNTTKIDREIDAFPISGLRVCTGQRAGASCGIEDDVDDMCTSGHCIAGTCHEEPLENGAICSKDSDCRNTICAFSSLEEGASTICCPYNDYKHVYSGELKAVCTS